MRTARFLLAIVLAANGLMMLFAPETWYRWVPGVADTGPLNTHFVRDIGCAYLVCAAAFVWLTLDAGAWPAALAGAAFLAMHALLHIGEAVTGGRDMDHLIADLPGVFLLPALALCLAWPRRRKQIT